MAQKQSVKLHPVYLEGVVDHTHPGSHMRRSLLGGIYHHHVGMDDDLLAYVVDKYQREGFKTRVIMSVNDMGPSKVVCAYLGNLSMDRGQENNVPQKKRHQR